MTDRTEEQMDEMFDLVRDSMYADDRQSSHDLDKALTALRTIEDELRRLRAVEEGREDHSYAVQRVGHLLAGMCDGPEANAAPFVRFIAALIPNPTTGAE